MKKMVITLHLALTLALLIAPGVLAQEEDPTEVEFTGTVMSIDLVAGTFTVETEEGDTFTVVPPEDFDLTTLQEGDEVEVEGTLAEDGTVLAISVKIEVADDEDDQDEVDDEINYFCRPETEEQHPVAVAIAETYGVPEEQVMAWFCENGFGFGQIMLALQTSQASGGDANELLARRSAGEGWGQIWISMELIGQESDAHPPGRPEDAGPPEWAGPPEDAGPPEGVGPPEWVGPPDNISPESRP